MNETLKNKVKNAVELYKTMFPTEYNQVIIEIGEFRNTLKTEYAEVIDGIDNKEHALIRELYRVPEKLYYLFIKNMTEKELKTMDTKEYGRWFVKTFPQFKVTKDA